MSIQSTTSPTSAATTTRPPIPILALDLPAAAEAIELVDRLPRADFVKIGLQLFTAAGPDLVRAVKDRGLGVFLDLKLHDIPNTVARAVESAAALGVDLLTLHVSGGSAMLRAARAAAGARGEGPALFGVTVLTSLSPEELAGAWGRRPLSAGEEVVRLAASAHEAGLDGVVASVHEASDLRSHFGAGLQLLTPGIRLAGDAAGDQARVATPAEAARRGVDYVVIGRAVTAAADPAAALDRVIAELGSLHAERGVR